MYRVPYEMDDAKFRLSQSIICITERQKFCEFNCLTGRKWSWKQSIFEPKSSTNDRFLDQSQTAPVLRAPQDSLYTRNTIQNYSLWLLFLFLLWPAKLRRWRCSDVHQRWANLCSACHGKTDPAHPFCGRSFNTRRIVPDVHFLKHREKDITEAWCQEMLRRLERGTSNLAWELASSEHLD